MVSLTAPMRDFFRPEETSPPIRRRPPRPCPARRQTGLSLKALFWCVAAILISLALGRLT